VVIVEYFRSGTSGGELSFDLAVLSFFSRVVEDRNNYRKQNTCDRNTHQKLDESEAPIFNWHNLNLDEYSR
jgi:hypothetical protein